MLPRQASRAACLESELFRELLKHNQTENSLLPLYVPLRNTAKNFPSGVFEQSIVFRLGCWAAITHWELTTTTRSEFVIRTEGERCHSAASLDMSALNIAFSSPGISAKKITPDVIPENAEDDKSASDNANDEANLLPVSQHFQLSQ